MKRPWVTVAVSGAHSTGKSTFAARLHRMLLKQGVSIEIVHNSAVKARELGFPILYGQTFESTAWMMAETIQSEMEARLTSSVVLVDRGAPDALGYLFAALHHSRRTLERERLKRLEEICANWVAHYDLVVVTVLDPSVHLGQGRDTDVKYRVAVNEAIQDITSRIAPARLLLRRGQEDDVLVNVAARVMRKVSES